MTNYGIAIAQMHGILLAKSCSVSGCFERTGALKSPK